MIYANDLSCISDYPMMRVIAVNCSSTAGLPINSIVNRIQVVHTYLPILPVSFFKHKQSTHLN